MLVWGQRIIPRPFLILQNIEENALMIRTLIFPLVTKVFESITDNRLFKCKFFGIIIRSNPFFKIKIFQKTDSFDLVFKSLTLFLRKSFFINKSSLNFQETYNALCTDIKHLQKAAQNQLYRFRYFDSLQEISFNENLRNLFSFEFSGNKYLLINGDGCLSHTFIFNSTMFYPLEFGIVTGQIDQIVPVKRKNKNYLVTRSTSDECLVRGTNIWELIENTLKVSLYSIC